MKALTLVFSLAVSTSIYAQCPKGSEGDGRLWPTKVKSVVPHAKGCRAIPERGQTDSNPMCPFDDSGILTQGIEVGVDKNGECAKKAGDSISGNLLNTEYGIELEGAKHPKEEICEIDGSEFGTPKDLKENWDKVREKIKKKKH